MKSLIKDSLNDTKAKTTERPNIASSGLDDVNQKLVDIINRSRAKIFVIGAGEQETILYPVLVK